MISLRKYIATFFFLCPVLVYAQAELYALVSPITSESNNILESLFGDINGLLGIGSLKDSIMGSVFRLLNVAIALFDCPGSCTNGFSRCLYGKKRRTK